MATNKNGFVKGAIKWTRRITYTLALVVFALLVSITIINWHVVHTTAAFIHNNLDSIPSTDVGLVLGTSKHLVQGGPNIYFQARMSAAADLYHTGKIKHLIVSGDNRHENYNEPRDMYRQLLELGVPASAITMDYAGFRTLDSVIRSQKIFKQKKIVIISQRFHNHRAIFIARFHGLDATAYNAPMPDGIASTRLGYREILARCKAVIDLYILGKEPYFLGETIDIGV